MINLYWRSCFNDETRFSRTEVGVCRLPQTVGWVQRLERLPTAGFTALSTQITAEELLDLVNAIFTSIDAAAACICPVSPL